jgi:CHASE3 domain sensor protein
VDVEPPRSRLRTRSVRGELTLLFRWISLCAILLLVVNVGSRVIVLTGLRPQSQQLNRLQDDLSELHSEMLNEETGLRGYLATGVSSFLEPYRAAKPQVQALSDHIAGTVPKGRMSRDFMVLQKGRCWQPARHTGTRSA